MDKRPAGFWRGAEDAEHAEWLAEVFDHKVRFDHTTKLWHIFNGIRWAPDQVQDVQKMVTEFARQRVAAVAESGKGTDDSRKEEMKRFRTLFNHARVDKALIKLAELEDYKTDGMDWDTDPFLLGCENGVVDLRLNEIIEASPEQKVTLTTGHNFIPMNDFSDAGKRAPRFMSFLDEVTSGDASLTAFYLLWFGYSLFGLSTEQRFLLLTGVGRNGKGKLVEAMQNVFGEYNAPAGETLYMRSRFGATKSDAARADLVVLKGKRLAIMSEPPGGAFNDEMLKAHTGGDRITARDLYGKAGSIMTWVPTHTITFLTNHPPKVDDIGPSMANRVMVGDFNERYVGENEDKHLGEKLKAESEGILAILCWAAKAWFDSEAGITLPPRVQRAVDHYLQQNDPLGTVVEDMFVIEKGARGQAKLLYAAYLEWFHTTGQDGEAISQTAFGLKMQSKGFTAKHTSTGSVYVGIRCKSAMEIAMDTPDE